MSQNIIISGITSFRNHGVEALVVSTIGQLRQLLPGASFTVLDREPDFDNSRMTAPDVKFIQDYTIRPLYGPRWRGFLTSTFPRLDRHAHNTANIVKKASCVVASGGDVFCSEYGWRSLLTHLQPLKIAHSAHVPFVIHAQSIGPFSNDGDRNAFMATARHAAVISVREMASYRYITEDLKLPGRICHHMADPAFMLGQPDKSEGDALFAHHRAVEGKPTIALSTSRAICHWMNSNDDRHIDTWLEVIRWLRQTLDANIILIPHVQETAPKNEDRILATEIQRRLRHDPRVRLAGGDFSASDYKAIISRCDFAVAERMHAALAGLSTGVPTLVIGYSIKAEGILTDLLGGEVTKAKALISIQDFIAPGAGLARVQAAWEARSEISQRLAATVPGARDRAKRAHELIAKACKS